MYLSRSEAFVFDEFQPRKAKLKHTGGIPHAKLLPGLLNRVPLTLRNILRGRICPHPLLRGSFLFGKVYIDLYTNPFL
jgi:hypothetical protein